MDTINECVEVGGAIGVREKILFILKVYPILNNTMLQVGLGTGVPPKVWRPVLEQLVKDGLVIRVSEMIDSPLGQNRSYTKLSLAPGA